MTNSTTAAPATKTCARCGEAKPETAFHVQRHGRRRRECGKCRAEARRARGERRRRRPETREERLARKLWEEYRLTREQYSTLVDAQGGLCAICGKPPPEGRRLAIDHCHATGVVRALLCTYCNVMVVGAYENHSRAAAEYLAMYGPGNPLLK